MNVIFFHVILREPVICFVINGETQAGTIFITPENSFSIGNIVGFVLCNIYEVELVATN